MFENSNQRLYHHFRLIVEMMNVEQMRKLAVQVVRSMGIFQRYTIIFLLR